MFLARHVSTRSLAAGVRQFSSGKPSKLKQRLAEDLIPKKQEQAKNIKKLYGEKVLGNCTVEQAYGGMRDIPSMVTETSLLDAQEGIRFRGLSIPECQEKLPTAIKGGEPLPEGMLYLLLTGEVPTKADVAELQAELASRSEVPTSTISLIRNLPKETHPMTQLCLAVLSLQPGSHFAKAYSDGINKAKYWEPCFEDALDLIAKLPQVAAQIYCSKYSRGAPVPNNSLDWSANYAQMLGFNDQTFWECMRLYLTLHCDHEGGNVSAHATHLVGSALSDPYLSFSAGMAGLAGPLHGLANQECFKWLQSVAEDLKKQNLQATPENLKTYIWATLKAGKVVPGYGHAVLRKTDPRFTAERVFGAKHLPNDPLFHLMDQLYNVIPGVLTEHGKTKNPWPNVDCGSGVLLNHFGLKELEYYTVLFGVSRAIGVLSSLVWDRALGLPLERPKSFTSDWIQAWGEGKAKQ